MRIGQKEKVKHFNVRYRSLYLKLDKKRRRMVSVIDYSDSLQNNKESQI